MGSPAGTRPEWESNRVPKKIETLKMAVILLGSGHEWRTPAGGVGKPDHLAPMVQAGKGGRALLETGQCRVRGGG